MACSSVALALVLWIVVQCGSQSGMTAVMDATHALKIPFQTIQSYLDTYTDWQHVERVRRGARRLPQLETRELSAALALAETQLNMTGRHEANIMSAGVRVGPGSVLHGAYVESLPTTDALSHGRDAAIVLRASQHLANKYCQRLGMDAKSCAAQVSRYSLSGSGVGDQCAAHYRQAVFCSELTRYRSHDGSCNHPHHPAWGQALTAYGRFLPPHYDDGFQRPRGSTLGRELPSARELSVALSQGRDLPDPRVTLAALQWGQFIAQDLAHTPLSKMWNTGGSIACCDPSGRQLSPRHRHSACFPVQVPSSDRWFSKTYQSCMSYVRSLPALRPDCSFGPLEQLNQASHLLDGSMVYGSSSEKAGSLRVKEFGRLRTVMKHGRDFLTTIESLNVNCHVGKNGTCYQTGDVRVNVQPHIAVMHTLWLREHNRVADRLATLNSHWTDDRLYQEARRVVIAQIQHITYNEWLPVVLGMKYMRSQPLLQVKPNGHSTLFREDVDPAVTNSFATAAMRSINSMVEDHVRLYDENRQPKLGSLSSHSFHTKGVLHDDSTVDALVRGLATQSSQTLDLHHSPKVQHHLYTADAGDAGPLGLDILSLDIQRGRDHGLPSYNAFRERCGLRSAVHFTELTDTIPTATVTALSRLYSSVNDIDLLVGGLAEYSAEGLLGPVLKCVIADQFTRTRVGDRYFYDNAFVPGAFTEAQLNEIKKTTLARVFCDNTNNVLNMQPYVFYKPITPSNELAACSESGRVRRMSLEPWTEEPPRSVLHGL